VTEEHKANLSKAVKGKIVHTEEQIRLLVLRSSQPINKFDNNMKLIKTYNTKKECCIDNKLNSKKLNMLIKTQTSSDGFLYKKM